MTPKLHLKFQNITYSVAITAQESTINAGRQSCHAADRGWHRSGGCWARGTGGSGRGLNYGGWSVYLLHACTARVGEQLVGNPASFLTKYFGGRGLHPLAGLSLVEPAEALAVLSSWLLLSFSTSANYSWITHFIISQSENLCTKLYAVSSQVAGSNCLVL